jgi:hypothetical protein
MKPDWHGIGARITPAQPIDLDEFLFDEGDTRRRAGAVLTARAGPVDRGGFSTNLWDMTDEQQVCVGVRVTKKPDNISQIAAHLVAIAIERGVTPVILSEVVRSGFEQSGFRMERILGNTPQQRADCEADLSRFWNLVVTVDVEAIPGLL